jgi:distribution and morphology protein 34
MFREDLPGIIHRLSQQWVKAKVEAPYLDKGPIHPPSRLSLDQLAETRSLPEPSYAESSADLSHAGPSRYPNRPSSARRARSSSSLSAISRKSAPILTSSTPSVTEQQSPSALPDIENFDPTYGLRPEGLPAKSLFGHFSRLFAHDKGLAELSEEPSEEIEEFDDEGGSFDILPWDDKPMSPISPSTLDSLSEAETTNDTEYETIPAVGGGLITRPRIYHSQSQIQTPTGLSSVQSSRHSSRFPGRALSLDYEPSVPSIRGSLPSIMSGHPSFRPSPLSNPYFVNQDGASTTKSSNTLNYANQYKREMPPAIHATHAALSHHPQSGRSTALPTPPLSDSHTEPGGSPTPIKRSLDRRSSISSSVPDGFHFGSPPDPHGTLSSDPDPKIILRPSLNNYISKLSTLSHSNHTLSPYTRSFEHFTVRSVPPRAPLKTAGLSIASDRQFCVKAKRKRIYRVGSASKDTAKFEKATEEPLPPPPLTPSPDFDASDMDRYFRWRDEVVPHFPPDIHPSHLRRRPSQQNKM